MSLMIDDKVVKDVYYDERKITKIFLDDVLIWEASQEHLQWQFSAFVLPKDGAARALHMQAFPHRKAPRSRECGFPQTESRDFQDRKQRRPRRWLQQADCRDSGTPFQCFFARIIHLRRSLTRR